MANAQNRKNIRPKRFIDYKGKGVMMPEAARICN